MTEDTTNLVLKLLRRIRADIAEVREELVDMKLRLSNLEQVVGQVSISIANLQTTIG